MSNPTDDLSQAGRTDNNPRAVVPATTNQRARSSSNRLFGTLFPANKRPITQFRLPNTSAGRPPGFSTWRKPQADETVGGNGNNHAQAPGDDMTHSKDQRADEGGEDKDSGSVSQRKSFETPAKLKMVIR
ncbi:hypothetical protein CGMCC3_g17207 [Colletotrichum fructicola]|nr:uncharacterized protein CGMCC3_g17207 [Colletotrichum fructicola]KAE9566637.1 hypothetical protein CGMCC3_g17207 [Colletotrichum fructicola]KAF4417605.1 hypothetical protein CFRS1_v015676 [Colletotrichum fructicola]